MSYKKFEDIQYLYENIDGQESDIEDLSNLIVEQLISEGYSENAIHAFMETADEFALQEKIMQLDEKDLSKIKKGLDLLRRFGKSAITRLRRNTPVNVRKNINRKGTQVKDALTKGKDKVVNTVKNNPKTSSAVALSGLTASAIASREKNNKDKTDDTGTKSGTFKDSQGKEFPTTDTIRGTKPDPNAGRLTYSKSKGQGNQTVVANPNRQGGEKAKEILDKKSSDAKIDKQVDKYVADRKVPINRDLTIDKSEEGKAKYAEKAAERAAKETEKKVEKVETPKPVKMSNLERQNRARFGDTEIDRLKTKQTDFRKMQSKDMSKDDFIKKYPKSITAQKAAGLRDHYDPSLNEDGSIGKVVGGLAKPKYDGEVLTKSVAKPKYDGEVLTKSVAKPKYDGEVLTRSVIMTKDQAKKLNSQISQRNKTKTEDFDAFDIVLGYLSESGQVDSMDEALYIMMEMDAATIQSIVRDFEMLTEEEADRMKDERLEKYGIGHDGSDRKAGSGGRSDSKKPKGKTNLQKETEKKHGKGKSPLDVAKANIISKYGKGAIAPSKKKKK